MTHKDFFLSASRSASALLLICGLGGSAVAAETAEQNSSTTTQETEATDNQEFKIIIEAEIPAGFPEPGPAGEVTLKIYPAYRAARADGRGSFRILFNHIQRHDIAMTAPVEMTLDRNEDGQAVPRPTDMAFLYVDPELGELGADPADPRVNVLDLPARTYLSYGFFGNANVNKMASALEKISSRLAEEHTLTTDGLARLMGYNSPFVLAPLRYHEVQQPVVAVAEDKPQTESAEAD